MNEEIIQEKLSDLPVGVIHFYPAVGSTNEIALKLSKEGADDLTLVIADAQTEGKGRLGRRWFSYPGTGLAFSLIFQPESMEQKEYFDIIPRYTGLGALAVCQVLRERYSLPAKIKWPNDVLINNRKCCGILVEVQWSGVELSSIVLGIGINITKEAIPISEELRMMATSVEMELGAKVDRVDLLCQIIHEILNWRSNLYQQLFIQAWESNLAFLGREVVVIEKTKSGGKGGWRVVGKISGLERDGALRLTTPDGEDIVIHNGEIFHQSRV